MEIQTNEIETSEPNYVAFRSAEQDYCVDIMDVREIRRWTQTTALPGAPDYVNGVINLRGSVVPIIDFSQRLGLEKRPPSERNVIVIVQTVDRVCGLLVDEVSEILRISENHVQKTRAIGPSAAGTIVTGVILLDERMIRLVNLDHIIDEDEPGGGR
jgi:purine-binding chemotaxis protein CheW